MPNRIAISLLLLCLASAAASARDGRHLAPDGDGEPCPEALVTGDAPVTPGTESRSGAPSTRARAATPRSTDGGAARTPRWHSFLPGMFR